MTLSKDTAQQLLEDLIFDGSRADDWVQDVWALSPLLGQGAANLVDVMAELLNHCSDEQVEQLLKSLYQQHQAALTESEYKEQWQQLMS